MNKEQFLKYEAFAKENLGLTFHDINTLVTALTHRSYDNEHKKFAKEHNERLEFLGDAILELVTTDYLYKNFNEPEGILTSWRAALVRTESIGAAGESIGIRPLIRMSKGEKNGSERAHQVIIADAFEALIGAIYLDHGYAAAEKFIKDTIIVKLDDILNAGTWRDPKSHLQELAQRNDGQTPTYRVLSEEGPDHDKTFTLGVFVGDRKIGTGVGHSKQEAQAAAAAEAITRYRRPKKLPTPKTTYPINTPKI
jgi:ribonuclease-3